MAFESGSTRGIGAVLAKGKFSLEQAKEMIKQEEKNYRARLADTWGPKGALVIHDEMKKRFFPLQNEKLDDLIGEHPSTLQDIDLLRYCENMLGACLTYEKIKPNPGSTTAGERAQMRDRTQREDKLEKLYTSVYATLAVVSDKDKFSAADYNSLLTQRLLKLYFEMKIVAHTYHNDVNPQVKSTTMVKLEQLCAVVEAHLLTKFDVSAEQKLDLVLKSNAAQTIWLLSPKLPVHECKSEPQELGKLQASISATSGKVGIQQVREWVEQLYLYETAKSGKDEYRDHRVTCLTAMLSCDDFLASKGIDETTRLKKMSQLMEFMGDIYLKKHHDGFKVSQTTAMISKIGVMIDNSIYPLPPSKEALAAIDYKQVIEQTAPALARQVKGLPNSETPHKIIKPKAVMKEIQAMRNVESLQIKEVIEWVGQLYHFEMSQKRDPNDKFQSGRIRCLAAILHCDQFYADHRASPIERLAQAYKLMDFMKENYAKTPSFWDGLKTSETAKAVEAIQSVIKQHVILQRVQHKVAEPEKNQMGTLEVDAGDQQVAALRKEH